MHPANKPKRITSWHVIGAQLSHFRKAARLTQPALAEAVGLHEDTIGSIEQGRRALKIDLAETLDELLDTKGALAVAVSKVPEREKLPAFVQSLVEHEEEALTLLSYQNSVVPGLLQTRPYARALFSCLYPPIHDELADDWVTARIDRQKVWDRNPPLMANFILDEAILHRPIGGPEVMHGQIEHLRQCADLPSLGLQIMPTSQAEHASLAGPLIVLETPEHEYLTYIEAQRISFLVDDPDEVSVYQQKYGMLRSQALNPRETKGLLDDLLGGS
ncbi:Scr1 family TA system antitoxin-like transcriptional regulator [Streptomyces sp. NPDC059649]|uniref:helix-turn-helix domain-containing protein n=1 Tax=Streptomyces sp. NPDC059649 TaxID=3346895 RepID=UPI0036CE0AAB